MEHYVCTGSCGEESRNPGICGADFCSKKGKSLEPCSCEDGMHENAGKKIEEENPDLI